MCENKNSKQFKKLKFLKNSIKTKKIYEFELKVLKKVQNIKKQPQQQTA